MILSASALSEFSPSVINRIKVGSPLSTIGSSAMVFLPNPKNPPTVLVPPSIIDFRTGA